MSIASEISRLLQAKADIKIAIEGKGVTVSGSATLDDYSDLIDAIQQGSEPNLQSKSVSITENGTTTVEPDTGYDGLSDVDVSVNVPTGGGEPEPENDVNFFDYDGTIVKSYSAGDFLALSALPDNPSHDGFVAQGWNWSLSDAKEYVQEHGKCNLGQMYTTESGNTEIDVEFDSARYTPYLVLAVNGVVSIDWGDGSTPYRASGSSLTSFQTAYHAYPGAGKYTISISIVSGTFTFYGSSNYTLLRKGNNSSENYVYANCVKAVRIGNGVTSIGSSAFGYCYSLEYITMPRGVTSIDSGAFYYCYSLGTLLIPSGVTSIGTNCCNGCHSLKYVSLPNGITNISNNAFYYCYSIAFICIPNSVTTLGASSFGYCHSMKYATLSNSITSFGNNALYTCYSLKEITIPNGVTSVGANIFNTCYSLTKAFVSSSVTYMNNGVFAYCYGLKEIHFYSSTPPTLGGTGVFNSIPSDCRIYVPSESLEDYKAANNWSSKASQMVGE